MAPIEMGARGQKRKEERRGGGCVMAVGGMDAPFYSTHTDV